MNALFQPGDKVVSNTDYQGLTRGQQYEVVRSESSGHGFFAYSTLFVLAADGREIGVVNSWMVLAKVPAPLPVKIKLQPAAKRRRKAAD